MTIDELVEAAKVTSVTEQQLDELQKLLESDVPIYISNEFLERTYGI